MLKGGLIKFCAEELAALQSLLFPSLINEIDKKPFPFSWILTTESLFSCFFNSSPFWSNFFFKSSLLRQIKGFFDFFICSFKDFKSSWFWIFPILFSNLFALLLRRYVVIKNATVELIPKVIFLFLFSEKCFL